MDDDDLTLRDYFAGQALIGQLAAMNPGFADPAMATQAAVCAYRIADEMMKFRALLSKDEKAVP